MLEPRLVQLGRKLYGDIYQVLERLKEGERVVASANFLIDAESKIQGAVKSFEGDESRRGDKSARRRIGERYCHTMEAAKIREET